MPHADHRNADSALHLPQILCLHAGGTNTRIFRTQCRNLEAQLRPHFRLCYAEAPFSSDVLAVYKHLAPSKRWLRLCPEHPEIGSQEVVQAIRDSLKAAMYADNLRGGTGDWVGLLGFSQGAKLAASLLLADRVVVRPY